MDASFAYPDIKFHFLEMYVGIVVPLDLVCLQDAVTIVIICKIHEKHKIRAVNLYHLIILNESVFLLLLDFPTCLLFL